MNDTHRGLAFFKSGSLMPLQLSKLLGPNVFNSHANEDHLKTPTRCRVAPYRPFPAPRCFRVRALRIFDDVLGFIRLDVVLADVFDIPPTPQEDDLFHLQPCGFMSGNRITSRMLSAPVSIISSRSTPNPIPPAGGMP